MGLAVLVTKNPVHIVYNSLVQHNLKYDISSAHVAPLYKMNKRIGPTVKHVQVLLILCCVVLNEGYQLAIDSFRRRR